MGLTRPVSRNSKQTSGSKTAARFFGFCRFCRSRLADMLIAAHLRFVRLALPACTCQICGAPALRLTLWRRSDLQAYPPGRVLNLLDDTSAARHPRHIVVISLEIAVYSFARERAAIRVTASCHCPERLDRPNRKVQLLAAIVTIVDQNRRFVHGVLLTYTRCNCLHRSGNKRGLAARTAGTILAGGSRARQPPNMKPLARFAAVLFKRDSEAFVPSRAANSACHS